MNALTERALARASENVRRLNPGLFRLQGNGGDWLKDEPNTKRKTRGPIAVRGESKLETRFRIIWESIDGPKLEREYVFHPGRRWRADFAHLESRVLIEVEGGAYMMGRHSRPVGFLNDCEKYLQAAFLGWTVVRLSSKQLNKDTLVAVAGMLRRRAFCMRYSE